MRYLSIIVIVLLCGCGQFKPGDPRTIHGVDSGFSPYVSFYTYIKGSGLSYDIPIQFVSLPLPLIGYCTRWSDGYRQIEIDPTYWQSASEDGRITLIFHELGHCDLNRNHDTSLRSNGWPTSLMYPYDVGYIFEDAWYYFNELFHPGSSSTELPPDDSADYSDHIRI